MGNTAILMKSVVPGMSEDALRNHPKPVYLYSAIEFVEGV